MRERARTTVAGLVALSLIGGIAGVTTTSSASPHRGVSAVTAKNARGPKVTLGRKRRAHSAVWRVHFIGSGTWNVDWHVIRKANGGTPLDYHAVQSSRYSWNLTFDERQAMVFQTPWPCMLGGTDFCKLLIAGLVTAHGTENVHYSVNDRYQDPAGSGEPPPPVQTRACTGALGVRIPPNSADAESLNLDTAADHRHIDVWLKPFDPVSQAIAKLTGGDCQGLVAQYWRPISVFEPASFFYTSRVRLTPKEFATHRSITVHLQTLPANTPRCAHQVPAGTGSYCKVTGRWSAILRFDYDGPGPN